MAHSAGSITSAPVQYTFATRVFGSPHTPSLEALFHASSKALTAPVEKLFLNESAATSALSRAAIPLAVSSLVTFSSDPTHQRRWERSASITRTTTPDGARPAAQANLQALARDLGACIAIPQLYGQDFLDRNPTLLSDLWTFDNDTFPLLLLGVPTWLPVKPMRDGLAARARIHAALEGVYRRARQARKGLPVDFGADVSDVSEVVRSRERTYEAHGWSDEDMGKMEMGLFWGQNANTQPVVFWLLTYVYSTPGLLARVRDEVAAYLTVEGGELVGVDVGGLARGCQLLRACVFETYRLVNDASSIRYVARPVTVADGERKHELRADSFFSALGSIENHDASVYADPDRFDPERFLQRNPETGESVARYGRLKPWGAGMAMCKGRTFAEREIMALGAAIFGIWDVEPVGGTWKVPERMPGTGVQKPVKDIRVLISRRK